MPRLHDAMRSALLLSLLVAAEAFVPLAFPIGLRGRTAGVSLRMSGSPASWQKAVDQESGRDYWYNVDTQESSWEAPPGVAATPAAPAAPYSSIAAKAAQQGQQQRQKPKTKSLMQALNPLKEGVNPLEHPSLILFISFKLFIVGWAVFVGFHNQYAGDFGPFITFHDGQVDFGTAATEWARLHAAPTKALK